MGEPFRNMSGRQLQQNQGLIKELLGAEATKNKIDAAKEIATTKAGAAGAKSEKGDLWKFSDRFSKDPERVKADAAIESADQMGKLLATNESPSVLMAKIQALRASGLQRITNFEISSFNGDQSAAGKFQQALQTLQEGNLTEGNVDEFKNAVKVLKDSAQKVKSNRKEYYSNLGKVTGLDQTKTGLLMGDQPQAAQQGQQGLVYDGSTPALPMPRLSKNKCAFNISKRKLKVVRWL
jgi:hypothetical protein